MKRNTIRCCDALEGLQQLPDESVDVIVTSPPYWALRDYGIKNQLGAEQDFEDYLSRLLTIFDEAKRVLKSDGTCWINLGDTYASPGTLNAKTYGEGGSAHSAISSETRAKQGVGRTSKVQAKSLIGIPERFVLGMLDRGWILRNKIVWHKPNHMPSSARDRFACSWEYLFLFVKSRRYYFDLDAVREPHKRGTPLAERDFRQMMAGRQTFKGKPRPTEIPHAFKAGHPLGRSPDDAFSIHPQLGRPRFGKERGWASWGGHPFSRERKYIAGTNDDYWDIPTKPFKGAHFAVFPEALIERPIKTSPEQICVKCGTPRRRLTKAVRTNERSNISALRRDAKRRDKKIAQPLIKYDVARFTTGWTDCKCGAGFKPALILDPFIGSGTTAVVAKRLGRDYLGFDLKPEYVKLAQERLRQVTQDSKGGVSSRAA